MTPHLGIRILSICILFLITGCEEDRISSVDVGGTTTVSLKGSDYKVEWVTPDSPILSKWGSVCFRAQGPYKEHAHPIHNLLEDLPSGSPENDDWSGLWEQLASKLVSKIDWYALAAYDKDKLAGMIRFFPKTMTRPRYGARGAK